MSRPINFDEALAEPPDLVPDPPQEMPRLPLTLEPTRLIENQLVSATFAYALRDDFQGGFRDVIDPINNDAFALFGILSQQPSEEQVTIELEASNADRAELGLDPIDPNLFVRFRGPDLARSLTNEIVIAMGMEQEFAETLTVL